MNPVTLRDTGFQVIRIYLTINLVSTVIFWCWKQFENNVYTIDRVITFYS